MEDIRNFTKVPDDHIVLFGECFNNISDEERSKYLKIYQFEGKDYVWNEAAKYLRSEDYL
jgi:hypothetical protein